MNFCSKNNFAPIQAPLYNLCLSKPIFTLAKGQVGGQSSLSPTHLNTDSVRSLYLRRLYHEKEARGYNLRTRPHNFALPVKDDNNFVARSLYAQLKS